MTNQEIIEDFFAYSFDSPEAPESTERYWEKALLDDKDYVIPSDNVCAYIRRLLRIPYGEFLLYVRQNPSKEPIESKNITQCSSFVACERDLCKIFLEQNNPGLSYEEIGGFLKNKLGLTSDRADALKKYGENQVKTAKQLGLAFEYYGDWYMSILGYVYLLLSPEEQHSLIARTLLRDRLYAKILSDLSITDVDLLSYMDSISADSTKARRYGCVEFLVKICLEECSREDIYVGKIKQRRSFQKKNDEWIATHYNQYAPIAVHYSDYLPINLARRSYLRIPQEGTRSDKYLHLISAIPPLKTTEERELLTRGRNGDKAAIDAICESYLPTLYNIAHQFNEKFPFVDIQDLVGEGVIALCAAISSFNTNYNNRIITYAIGGIKQRMRACVFEQYSLIPLPLASQALEEKVENAVSYFTQRNERRPSAEEIAELVDVPINIIAYLFKYYSREIVDIDKIQNDTIFEHNYNAADWVWLAESLTVEINRALATLTPREADILMEFFGIGKTEKTLEEIGDELHLTRERVRQIKDKAIRKLYGGQRCHILMTYLGTELPSTGELEDLENDRKCYTTYSESEENEIWPELDQTDSEYLAELRQLLAEVERYSQNQRCKGLKADKWKEKWGKIHYLFSIISRKKSCIPRATCDKIHTRISDLRIKLRSNTIPESTEQQEEKPEILITEHKHIGYCIRCGKEIDYTFGDDKPRYYCKDCWKDWYHLGHDPKQKEHYCHRCGKRHPSSVDKPICWPDCWKEINK